MIPDVKTMVAELVAINSVSSVSREFDHGNRAVIDLLAGWCEALGFRVTVQPVSEHPEKSNLVAVLGSGEDGLVLAGHTDTVPYDETGWASDPFRLDERDGHWYGLGVADMKAFLALVLEAARGVDARTLRRPLVFVATADEESSMDGARRLVDHGGLPARHCVIGEPTALKPIRMHKGIIMEAVRLTGRSGHSSDPSLGRNALDAMREVLNALDAWRAELARAHREPAFHVAQPTLNFGHVHGGDNPNRICAQCELHFDLRMLPGMRADDLRAQIDALVAPIASAHEVRFERRALFEGIEAMETAADARIVDACERLSGQRAGAVAFGTEGPFFAELGIDTVILGPVDIEVAHQPNESLPVSRVEPCIAILRGLIAEFCQA